MKGLKDCSSPPWEFFWHGMPLDGHPHLRAELADNGLHRTGLHSNHFKEESGLVGQMRDAAGHLPFAVDEGIGGGIYFCGLVGWSHHNHIAKHIVMSHHAQLTRIPLGRLYHEFLPEERLSVGTFATAGDRKDVIVVKLAVDECLATLIMLSSRHKYLRIEECGRRVRYNPGVGYACRVW